MTKRLLLASVLYVTSATAVPLLFQPDQLQFRYQKNLEPWESAPCFHQKASVGLYEWDVECTLNRKRHLFFVHLVTSYYAQTIHGTSAYEILYWVTDMTHTGAARHDSSTVWVHNSHPENRMRVLEAAQGVEDDGASLRLVVRLE